MRNRLSLLTPLLIIAPFAVDQLQAESTPNVRQDIVLFADTLGIRPGMTLAEAQVKAASLGAEITSLEPLKAALSNNFVGGPAPELFRRLVRLSHNVMGPPFIGSTTPVEVGLTLWVFPRDPRVDAFSETNLVIYDIMMYFNFRTRRQDNDVQTSKEFVTNANVRFGPFKDETRRQVDAAFSSCMDALLVFENAAQRASLRSIGGETEYDQFPQTVAAGRKCRRLDYLTPQERAGQFSGAVIRRFDFSLAEEALLALTKIVGHEEALISVVMRQKEAKLREKALNK